jgi:hypothetical protein
MKQNSLLGSAIGIVLILGAILFFSKKNEPDAQSLKPISVEAVYEIASFDPTDRHCLQFQFVEKKGEHTLFDGKKSCTGTLQRESGPLLAHLVGFPECPAPGWAKSREISARARRRTSFMSKAPSFARSI